MKGKAMRRNAFQMFVSFGAGIYAASLWQITWVQLLGVLGTFIVPILLLIRWRKHYYLILLCGFMIGMTWFIGAQSWNDPALDWVGKESVIQGEVLTVTQEKEKATMVVHTKQGSKIQISVYDKQSNYIHAVGKRIQATGEVELPMVAGNPGGFDYRIYLRSLGISTVMQLSPNQIAFSQQPINILSHSLADFRYFFEKRLRTKIGANQTGLILAMMFGERSAMDEDVYESFQKNGTAHILSVSGLHVGFLYGILIMIFRGKRKVLPNIIIIMLLFLYGLLSGFCPSVNRALLMIGLHILSKILCRPYDLLSSAGIAGLLLLIGNPYQLFHPGFQLSFLAVILMGWLFPLVNRYLPNKKILSMVLPMPMLQLAMAPFTAYCFNYFSFGAFLANFGVVFFSGILIPAGILAMLFCGVSGVVFDLTAAFLDISLQCILWCNNLTYANGVTSFDVVSPSVFFLILFYGVIFFAFSEFGQILWNRQQYNWIGIILGTVVCIAVILNWQTENGFDKADAVFVDVGQGDCLHIRTPSGKNILIDGGGKENFDIGQRVLKPYLLKNGVNQIDLAIVTHLDTDHYDGIRSLATDGFIDRLGLYEGNQVIQKQILEETKLKQEQLTYLHSGDSLKVDNWVWLEFLYPSRKNLQEYEKELGADDENPRSLVVRVHIGQYQILMTGDINMETESKVIQDQNEQGVSADILKIGHHGSKYSTSDEFLNMVNPTVAVFQTGKNNYGHPSSTVLEKCKKEGIIIYRNDQDGAIGIFGLIKSEKPYLKGFKANTRP